MLFALMQLVGMGGGEPALQVGAGGGDDVRAPKRRRRGDRDHRWIHDPLWESIRLEREVLGASRAREEEIDDALDAAAVVETALEAIGGLAITPPPPPPVARALLKLQAPDYTEVIAAIRDAHRRERDRKVRARIMEYRAKVEAIARRERFKRDDEAVERMLLDGIL